jgi:hypothetical protein
MNITIDNIEEFNIPFEDFIGKWIFTDEFDKPAPIEHIDQITILNKEASKFLFDLESKLCIDCTPKFFKNVHKFTPNGTKEIKKQLYKLGIPFSQKVFFPFNIDMGFVLTWKMVIKYSHTLFWANDQLAWDKTLNWKLIFHHDGEFTFAKNFIYDHEAEYSKLQNALRENKNISK